MKAPLHQKESDKPNTLSPLSTESSRSQKTGTAPLGGPGKEEEEETTEEEEETDSKPKNSQEKTLL